MELGGGEEEEFKTQVDNDDEKSQTVIKMKHTMLSQLVMSHKNFVSDLAFVPGTINVDKRNPSNGKQTHLISISEDGIVNIWDTRQVEKT